MYKKIDSQVSIEENKLPGLPRFVFLKNMQTWTDEQPIMSGMMKTCSHLKKLVQVNAWHHLSMQYPNLQFVVLHFNRQKLHSINNKIHSFSSRFWTPDKLNWTETSTVTTGYVPSQQNFGPSESRHCRILNPWGGNSISQKYYTETINALEWNCRHTWGTFVGWHTSRTKMIINISSQTGQMTKNTTLANSIHKIKQKNCHLNFRAILYSELKSH
jgi:hypothetical protein